MNRPQTDTHWHTLSIADTLITLAVDQTTGLAADEAADRIRRFGGNELIEQSGRSPWRILWEQCTSTMALILIVAAVVSGLGRFTQGQRYHFCHRDPFCPAGVCPGLSGRAGHCGPQEAGCAAGAGTAQWNGAGSTGYGTGAG